MKIAGIEVPLKASNVGKGDEDARQQGRPSTKHIPPRIQPGIKSGRERSSQKRKIEKRKYVQKRALAKVV